MDCGLDVAISSPPDDSSVVKSMSCKYCITYIT